MKTSFQFILFAALTALLFTNCSDSDFTSVSPELGSLTISPSNHYTGQKATVAVTFSSVGEHVYFASSASFTCTVSGNGYTKTDTIPVLKTEDLRIPHDFSFQIILPPSGGTYQVTFRTPSINKSSTSSEGEALYFPPLTKQTTIRVNQADAINANFGDTREMVATYLDVNDSTITDAGFDPAAKASATTLTSDGFTHQMLYKFSSNHLKQVDDIYSYDIKDILIYDDNGNVTGAEITDEFANKVQKQANSVFTLEIVEEYLSDAYDPSSAKDSYGTLADEDSTSKWKSFLTALIKSEVKSYSFRCPEKGNNTYITVVITFKNDKIYITNQYTE